MVRRDTGLRDRSAAPALAASSDTIHLNPDGSSIPHSRAHPEIQRKPRGDEPDGAPDRLVVQRMKTIVSRHVAQITLRRPAGSVLCVHHQRIRQVARLDIRDRAAASNSLFLPRRRRSARDNRRGRGTPVAIQQMREADECRNVPRRLPASRLHVLRPCRAIDIRLRECHRGNLMVGSDDVEGPLDARRLRSAASSSSSNTMSPLAAAMSALRPTMFPGPRSSRMTRSRGCGPRTSAQEHPTHRRKPESPARDVRCAAESRHIGAMNPGRFRVVMPTVSRGIETAIKTSGHRQLGQSDRRASIVCRSAKHD